MSEEQFEEIRERQEEIANAMYLKLHRIEDYLSKVLVLLGQTPLITTHPELEASESLSERI